MSKADSIPNAITSAYMITDTQVTAMAKEKEDRSGCTSASAIIRINSDGERWLYTANAGDARIVLRHKGEGIRLTFDHKATDPGEMQRVTEGGGLVTMGRVASMLAIARAFGDYELKEWVIAAPYVQQVKLTDEDTHLIVACDGLWDVLTDQGAVDLIKDQLDMAKASEILVKRAIEKGSRDNVSVLAIAL